MPIAATTSPSQINSVSDSIEYEFTLSSPIVSDLNIEVIGATPYGLTKFGINHDPSYTPPTLAVGQIIYITSSAANLYSGAHVITEVLTSLECVVNTIYVGFDNQCRFDVYNNFNFDLYEFPNLSIDPAIQTIATLKGIPTNNNKIKFNISEYLRSVLNDAKPSLMFGLGLSNLNLYGNGMAANSTIKSSIMVPFFAVDNRIIENSETLVFFEGFKTYLSISKVQDTVLDVKREIENIAPFTQGTSFTYQKQSYQSVEVMNGCFKDALNIVFVNFAGGLRNYVVFNDIANGRDFENETTFKNSKGELRTLQVQSFKTYNVLTENVRITHAETVEQMISSPYTWLEIDGELVPIVIEKQSFQKYRSYDESLTISFNFRMSETKQSQVY